MSRELLIRNRQRTRALNVPLLRRMTRHILENELRFVSYELGFHFVEPAAMARVNEQFLQHQGSTDVITFDHGSDVSARRLHGEAFVCVADAVKQAREFETNWQSEVVRYIIHSLLHLGGYDDLEPAKRRLMKREEERLLRQLTASFKVADLARPRSQLSTLNPHPS